MKISQDECRRWVERATTQAANAVALFDEAKRLQKENAVLRAEVERYRSILSILEDEVYASASRVLPPTAVQSDEFNTLDVSDVCNRLVAEVERLENQASLFKIYMEALDRSPFDMSLCRVCGQPVVCLPDGLALCEPCAKRERIEQ